MRTNKVLEFAKNKGYNQVTKLGKWNDYIVYQPIAEKEMIVGMPQFILEDKNGKLEMYSDDGFVLTDLFYND